MYIVKQKLKCHFNQQQSSFLKDTLCNLHKTIYNLQLLELTLYLYQVTRLVFLVNVKHLINLA